MFHIRRLEHVKIVEEKESLLIIRAVNVMAQEWLMSQKH